MSLYDSLKEVAQTLKDTQPRELYEQLIDLGAQALELQHEVHRLTVENAELRKNEQIEKQIIRHKEPYLTLKYDSERIMYCARCWDYEKKLVQVKCVDAITYRCLQCNNTGIYEEVRTSTATQPAHTKRVFIFVK